MLYSIARVAGVLALLCRPLLSVALPSYDLAPEVPWKRSGLFDLVGRGHDNKNYDGCVHGPKARTCWGGDLNVDTDMDFKWPDTGKTVKVQLR